MRLEVFDSSLNRKAIAYHWVSLLWVSEYYGLGSFLIELQENTELFGYISAMDYVKLDVDDTVMIVTNVQAYDGKVIVGGFSANWILDNRVSNRVIKNQNAEEALRGLVRDMSPWGCVELGTSAGITDKFTAQTSDAKISEYCSVICGAVDMGYRFRKEGKKLLFECYKPTLNTAVRYAAKFGNIGNERYSESENTFANVAIVAGAGEGEDRVTVTAGDISAQGKDRREIYVDARHEQPQEGETDAEYRARLTRHGEKVLSEHYRIKNISFEIDEAGVKLGDLVPVASSLTGEQYTARVVSVTIKSQKNTFKRTVSVGTPILIKRS